MNRRLLKGFFIALVGLIIMIILISLLIPSRVMVTRALVVHAPAEKISSYLTNLGEWEKWHPVFMQDSSRLKLTVINNKEVLAWQQNGKENYLKIVQTVPSQVKFSLERGNDKLSDNIISVLPLADGTGQQVEWTSVNYLKWYPWQKFGGMFLNEISGPGYEMALQNLRNLAEGRPSRAN